MKKIFLLFFSTLFLALGSIVANELDDIDILLAVKRLDEINAQIQTLRAQAADKNETVEQNVLFKGVLTKKSELLEKIPHLIMEAKVDDEQVAQFIDERSKLEARVKKLKAANNKKPYIENSIKLEKMNLDSSFYKTLIGLGQLLESGARSSKIKSSVEDGLLDLQTNSYVNIRSLKSDIESMNVNDYNSQFDSLELYRKTFEEILIYLRDNAELLSSNYLFAELNLRNAIEFLNQKIPFETGGINLGKVIIIFVIFLFFISFTRILSAITYKILASLFAKNSHADYMKERVVKTVKRPIFFVLSIYAVDICASIFYYPAPAPIKFANFISIILIISYSWLILAMLSGYGTMFINEITKKSGRKEVINLIIKIVYFLIVVIAILLVLSRLGFNVSAIVASLGIGGLAVALATKDILANFFSSVMLLFDNSFSQGDIIACGNIEGTVVEIGLRNTTVRTFDNSLIFVPNSKLIGEPIINWSRRKVGRLIRMSVGLTYDSSSAKVKKCAEDIRAMLISHDAIAKDSDLASNIARYRQSIVSIDDMAGYKSNIFVFVDALNDSSIDISVICFTKATDRERYSAVKEDVILKIMEIVENNGLSFAFPSQSLYIENLKDMDKIEKI